MFEAICIRRKQNYLSPIFDEPIDVGFLAEALLFYQKVYLIADQGMLKALILKSQPDVLLSFLESGFLEIFYLENNTGVYTEDSGTPYERHLPTLFSIPDYAWQKHAPKLFSEAIGCSVKGGRRYSKQFSKYVKPLSFDDSVRFETLEDISNGNYIRDAVAHFLKYQAPEYQLPNPLIFNIDRVEIANYSDRFAVETNIDFGKANKSYHKHISPKHSSLSVAYLLSNLIEARGNWHFSSRFSSEVATDPVSSVIFSLKFNDLLAARKNSEEQISAFQDFIFDDARSISEVINSGERDFNDLWKLISEAAKFKHWLKDQQPNKQLVKEYFREVTKASWVDRLPSKSMRWTIFNAAGLAIDALGAGGIGKVLGLAVSAGDQFLLDKLLKGWKPNQFIDESLKKFVAVKNRAQPNNSLNRTRNEAVFHSQS
jgi:hypothetical protein